MNFNSHLQDSIDHAGRLPSGLTPEDIAALTHYPSLDKLFNGKDLLALGTIKEKLRATFQNLERVILRGSSDDAKKAQAAAAAVHNALDFLSMLEQLPHGETTT